ncbi:MAG: oligosaccharide flippase family protein [Desulfobacter sp.]|nr:MAG: oligosaccharide flippase family protein [Desulfobacter sp.]
MAVTVLLVRALSEHDYGIYNLLYSLIALMGMVFSFGIANTLQRYMPEYYSRGEYEIAHRLYRVASFLRLVSNITALAIFLLLWDFAAPILDVAAYKNYFLLFCFIIILHLQRSILETCLNSYFLQKYSQGFSLLFVLIKGVGYGNAIWFSWNLWHILVVDLLAYIIIFILLEIVYWLKVQKAGGDHEKIPPHERKRITRYALFYNFNDAGAGLLDSNFDNFIIAMYLNPIAVGAYSFCYRITRMADRFLPINYLLQVIQPSFFSGNQESSKQQITQNYQLLLKLTYLFQVPLFCFFLLYSQEMIIVFFSGKFLDYYLILVAVSIISLLNAFQTPLGLTAQLKEKAEIILYSKVFAVYNIFADIVLIHFFGIWGAVIATGSATLAKNLFIWFFVREFASFSGMSSFFFSLGLYWTGVAGTGWLLGCLIQNHFTMLGAGIVLISMAFAIQFRFLFFSEKERAFFYRFGKQNPKVRLLLSVIGLIKKNQQRVG